MLLSNPRHRAFYFGWLLGGGEPAEAPPRPVLSITLPETLRTPVPFPRLRPPAVPGAASGQAGGATGRVPVVLAERPPGRLPLEGVPPGWWLKQFAGRPLVELVRSDGRLALRLRSEQASFALYRDVIVDLREHPYLTWRWKAVALPARGDVRNAATDDQVAQVYVVFARWPSPRTRSDVIGYLWDSRAPVGTRVRSAKADNVWMIVVESGPARAGTWQAQVRDVAADYRSLLGKEPPRVGQVAVMVDADDTRGEAEALIADLAFEHARVDMKTPTSMLR